MKQPVYFESSENKGIAVFIMYAYELLDCYLKDEYHLKETVKVFALWVYWINCVFYICAATATHINDSKLGMTFSTCSIENNVQIVLDSGTFHSLDFWVRDAQPIPFIEARWSPNRKIDSLHKSRALKALGVQSLTHVSPWAIKSAGRGRYCSFLDKWILLKKGTNAFPWTRAVMVAVHWWNANVMCELEVWAMVSNGNNITKDLLRLEQRWGLYWRKFFL